MRIVELGDCSMVIMKDSEDPPWVSLGNIYRNSVSLNSHIIVDTGNQLTYNYIMASECVYSAGRLILFFKDSIPQKFQLHGKVVVGYTLGPDY